MRSCGELCAQCEPGNINGGNPRDATNCDRQYHEVGFVFSGPDEKTAAVEPKRKWSPHAGLFFLISKEIHVNVT